MDVEAFGPVANGGGGISVINRATETVTATISTSGNAVLDIATITLVNTGATAAEVVLNFFDNNGAALPLPLTFPQGSSNAPLLASTLDQTIGAGGELVVATAGTASQTTVQGWTQVLTNGSLGGAAVFVWMPPAGAQEAVVPIETTNPSAFVLPFDYTGGYASGVGLANLTNQAVNIPVVLRDSGGSSLGAAAPIALAAYGHTSVLAK